MVRIIKPLSIILSIAMCTTLLCSCTKSTSTTGKTDDETTTSKTVVIEDGEVDQYYQDEYAVKEITADTPANYPTTFVLNADNFRISDFTYNMDYMMYINPTEDVEITESNYDLLDDVIIWHDIKRFDDASETYQDTYYADFLDKYASKTQTNMTVNGYTYTLIDNDSMEMLMYNDKENKMIHKYLFSATNYEIYKTAYQELLEAITYNKDDAEQVYERLLSEYESQLEAYNAELEAYEPIQEKQQAFFSENGIDSQEALDAYLDGITEEEAEEVSELLGQAAPSEPEHPEGIVTFDGGYFVYTTQDESNQRALYRNSLDSGMYIGYGENEGMQFSYETVRVSIPDGYNYDDAEVLSYVMPNIITDFDSYELKKLDKYCYMIKNEGELEAAVNSSTSIILDGDTTLVQENGEDAETDGETTESTNKKRDYVHYDYRGFRTTITLFDYDYAEKFESMLSLEDGAIYDYTYTPGTDTSFLDRQATAITDLDDNVYMEMKIPENWEVSYHEVRETESAEEETEAEKVEIEGTEYIDDSTENVPDGVKVFSLEEDESTTGSLPEYDLSTNVIYSDDGADSLTLFKADFKNTVNLLSIASSIWSNYTYGYLTYLDNVKLGDTNYMVIRALTTSGLMDTYLTADDKTLYMIVHYAQPARRGAAESRYIVKNILSTIKYTEPFECKETITTDDVIISGGLSKEIPDELLDKISAKIGEQINVAESIGLTAYATSDSGFYIYELTESAPSLKPSLEDRVQYTAFINQLFYSSIYGVGKTANGKPYLERGGIFIIPSTEGTYYIGVEDTSKYTLETLEEVIDLL